MNDAETHKEVFEASELENNEAGAVSRSIYFYRDRIEVRRWSNVERKFVSPTVTIGENKDVAYSIDKLLADLGPELK